MKTISLKIDGQLADFFEDKSLSLSLNKSIADIQDYSKRIGNFSFSFKLPKTKTNNIIFQNIDIVQGLNKFNKYNNFIAELQLDGIQIMDGVLILLAINSDNYEVCLVGNNISWKTLIGGKSLREIQSLQGEQFIGAKNKLTGYEPFGTWLGQQDYWNLGVDDGIAVQFPLISYGRFYIGDKDITGISGTFSDEVTTRQPHNFFVGQLIYLEGEQSGVILRYGSGVGPYAYLRVVSVVDDYTFTCEYSSDGFTWSYATFPYLQGKFVRFYDENSNNNFIEELNFDDIPPSVYVVPTLKAIFNDIEWTIGGDWINRQTTKKLIMPYVGDDDPRWNWNVLGRFGATGTTEYSTSATTLFNLNYGDSSGINATGGFSYAWVLRNQTELFDFGENNNQYKDQISYICPTAGKYQFWLDLDIHSFDRQAGSAGSGNLGRKHSLVLLKTKFGSSQVDIYNLISKFTTRYGTVSPSTGIPTVQWNELLETDELCMLYSLSDPIYGPTLGAEEVNKGISAITTTYTQTGTGDGPFNGSGRIQILTEEFSAEKNDVFFWFYVTPNNPQGFYTLSDMATSATTFWSGTCSNGDYLLQPANLLPDISQDNFLKSLVSMFNLYLDADDVNKNIIIESRDDFYKDNVYAVDWTDKINSFEYSLTPIEQFRWNNFIYAEDSKDILGADKWADLRYENKSIYADGESVVKVPSFAATKELEYISLFQSGGTLQIPTMATSDQLDENNWNVNWNYDYTPRILTYDGIYNTSGVIWKHDDDPISGYPKASFYSGAINLKFGDDDGLFNEYYANTLLTINNSFILSTQVNINSYEFYKISLRDKIIINNNMFVLNKISNFKPVEDRLTQVELIKVI